VRALLSGLVGRAVAEVEALGELEVELDGTALPLAAESVGEVKVELGAVEGSVLGVEVPVSGNLLLKDLLERSLGVVPDLEVTHPLLGVTGRETDLVLEAEGLVDGVEELDGRVELLLDLVDTAEDVG
jgi:hypothetical protein